MNTVPSGLTLDDLVRVVPFVDGTGILMDYAAAHPASGPFADEISQLLGRKALYMMVNEIPPGIIAPPHTDTLPQRVQRWHLPLQTNAMSFWWDEVSNHFMHMIQGIWYGPVPYYARHSVMNFGTEPRIHVVVDLEL